MDIRFYTLLYIDPVEKRKLRGKLRSGNERIKIFLRNAALLNKSLTEFGRLAEPLVILTNNRSLIENLSEEIGYTDFSVREIPFTLDVPKGIDFYSAHFKIDAFHYFSTLDAGEYSILVDNDIVLLNGFPKELSHIVDARIPICYRLKGYNIDRIMGDARKILPSIPTVEWCGGEFIGGSSAFWEKLYTQCIDISASYFRNIDSGLFHVGDEMLTSLAVAKMTDEGYRILDAGNLNIITRYWGASESVPIDKIKSSLVHLPADKVFIANTALNRHFTPPNLSNCIKNTPFCQRL